MDGHKIGYYLLRRRKWFWFEYFCVAPPGRENVTIDKKLAMHFLDLDTVELWCERMPDQGWEPIAQ